MSLHGSEFLEGKLISKYNKLVKVNFEIVENKRKELSLTFSPC